MKRYVVAITGATGSILGIRFLKELIKSSEIHLIISRDSFPIIKHETGLNWEKATQKKLRDYYKSRRIFFYEDSQLFAPVSSGSFIIDGMIIIPCTMKTLSAVANGYANNLIERAADVTIKEDRKLILLPREMPFSPVHLENMLRLSKIGVTIAPPVLSFYHKPETINDILDFITGKIFDNLGIKHKLFKRWKV